MRHSMRLHRETNQPPRPCVIISGNTLVWRRTRRAWAWAWQAVYRLDEDMCSTGSDSACEPARVTDGKDIGPRPPLDAKGQGHCKMSKSHSRLSRRPRPVATFSQDSAGISASLNSPLVT
ncbi:hypothetical protein E4U54_001217 [Claviceps lovelessii]|nr:hypothetical protein E4U54_001217 [Claviceps lovelessii]